MVILPNVYDSVCNHFVVTSGAFLDEVGDSL